jgi:hypothetical protein
MMHPSPLIVLSLANHLASERKLLGRDDLKDELKNRLKILEVLLEARKDRPACQFVLGALHSLGHQLLCQLQFSVRRTSGMGLSTGEECEIFNSRMVTCSAALRKMRYDSVCE